MGIGYIPAKRAALDIGFEKEFIGCVAAFERPPDAAGGEPEAIMAALAAIPPSDPSADSHPGAALFTCVAWICEFVAP